MNILYVTTHLNIGGITSYLLSLTSGFVKRGDKVYVASSGGEMVPQLKERGGIHIPVGIKTKQEFHPKVLLSLARLLPEIEKNHIDILHAQTRVTQVLSAFLSRKKRIPYVTTCHGFFSPRFFRKAFPCWGNRVIAISEQVKEHLMVDFSVPAEKIKLIHNGIDIEKFRIASEKSRLEAKKKLLLKDAPVVGTMGRLSDVKGQSFLLTAMKEVLKSFPQAQLLIVGEGKMELELKRLSADLGIEKNCLFLPNVLDTREVLNAIDIFAMPSLQEGLGLSLMEAMSVGCAVIGSDIGGIRSLIKTGVNGVLVKPADSVLLAESIVTLIKDRKKQQEFALKSRSLIEGQFSLDSMVARTQEVYAACLNAIKS